MILTVEDDLIGVLPLILEQPLIIRIETVDSALNHSERSITRLRPSLIAQGNPCLQSLRSTESGPTDISSGVADRESLGIDDSIQLIDHKIYDLSTCCPSHTLAYTPQVPNLSHSPTNS